MTVWATSDATFREEAKDNDPEIDWSYRGEYFFILVLNQAGDRIQRIVEFVDSKKVAGFQALRERASRNLAARKENSS